MNEALTVYAAVSAAARAEDAKALAVLGCLAVTTSGMLVSGATTGPVANMAADPASYAAPVLLAALWALSAVASSVAEALALARRASGPWGSFVAVGGICRFANAAEFAAERREYSAVDDALAQTWLMARTAQAKRARVLTAVWLAVAAVILSVTWPAVYFCGL